MAWVQTLTLPLALPSALKLLCVLVCNMGRVIEAALESLDENDMSN